MFDTRHTIRNIDPDIYREARIHAVSNDLTLGQIVTEAIADYLGIEYTQAESAEVRGREFTRFG